MKIFFDSSAIMTWYKQQKNFEIVEKHLEQVTNSEIEGFISEINLVEILYQVSRIEDYNTALDFINDLTDFVGLKAVSHDWKILKKAAKYKIPGNIALPDCILLATAVEYKAKIITTDPEFKQFEKETGFIWL
jgi:predicted nucleic acid-binding protein